MQKLYVRAGNRFDKREAKKQQPQQKQDPTTGARRQGASKITLYSKKEGSKTFQGKNIAARSRKMLRRKGKKLLDHSEGSLKKKISGELHHQLRSREKKKDDRNPTFLQRERKPLAKKKKGSCFLPELR